MVFEHNLRVSITGYILWGGHPYFQEGLLTFRDFGIWHQKVAKFDNVDCTNNFSKNEHVILTSKREVYPEGWIFYKMVRGHKNLLMIESSPYRSPDGLLHPQDVQVV